MDYEEVVNKNALFSIANEIKKFHKGQNTGKDVKKHFYPIFDNVQWYKSTIKAKKKLLSNLQKKLNIVCIFAKILLTSKNLDTYKIRHMNNLYQTRTNQRLQNEISHDITSKLIHTAYAQLCCKQDESQVQEIDKLKEIICLLNTTIIKVDQEKAKGKMLERKNKFLTMKLMLTENHLEDLLNQNHLFRNNSKSTKINEFQKKNWIRTKIYPSSHVQNTVLNSLLKIKLHLSNIKLLVYEQANILQELEHISKRFEIESKVTL